MSDRRSKRSNEPVVWLLFAAGGMIASMLLPGLILVIGLAGPVGLVADGRLDYDQIARLVDSFTEKVIVFTALSLLFWHAMHRIYHGLHDLGLRTRQPVYRWICYGFAFIATGVTGGLLIQL